MEWVEFTARTLQEAKDLALDRLGVASEDAEFEVLEEPKPGLFGRLRGEARVRARVRPTAPRPKVERRGRRKPRDEESRPDSAARDADGGTAETAVAVGAATASAETFRDDSGPAKAPVAASTGGRSGGASGNTRAGGSGGNGGNGAREGGKGGARQRDERSDRPAGEDGPPVDPAQVGAEAERFLSGLVEA